MAARRDHAPCDDGRVKRNGMQCNFYVYYEADDQEEATALQLDEYDGTEECSWMLLEETEGGEGEEGEAA